MNTWMRNYLIFCHVAVPIVFLSIAKKIVRHPGFLTWQTLVLLAIAGLPFVLPLLAYYVKGIGKDGVMMNNVFDGTVPAPERKAAAVAAAAATQGVAVGVNARKLGDYSKPARKVIRTLWKFQGEQFKDDFSQRWAFGVHPMAMDYPQFRNGVMELRFDGLIQYDGRGMVFLTDEGVAFCRENENGLVGSGDVWDKFGPA